MLLRIFFDFLKVGIVIVFLCLIFYTERYTEGDTEKPGKYKHIIEKMGDIFIILLILYVIIFIIFNIIFLFHSIAKRDLSMLIIPASFLLFCLAVFILKKGYFFLLCALIIMFTLIVLVINIIYYVVYTVDTEGKLEYVKTINIVEFKQVPYTSISGTRYYIKSTPGCAYYYEVKTPKGSTTTKVIDGTEYYVEKYEDDKYIQNPHIVVYRKKVISFSPYIKIYGLNYHETIEYEYHIYIPENSIFYEE